MSSNAKLPHAYRALRRNGRRVLLESILASRRFGEQRQPPDFIIVGAQRCGTTSLFRALAKHPALMSNVINSKGVHYFGTNHHKNASWYFAHFPSQKQRDLVLEKTGHAAVVGEASPYYLFHPAVAERISKTAPDTKIVVLLRDPVKRAISHHLHMVWEGHEHESDIDKALDLEATRLAGVEEQLLNNPAFVSRPHQHFSYIARGHYAAQLERYFTHFDRDNVLVMATETLVADSENSLAQIQSFIGLTPDPAIKLEKRNSSAKFEPKPETIERLKNEYRESNQQLLDLVGDKIPWLKQ